MTLQDIGTTPGFATRTAGGSGARSHRQTYHTRIAKKILAEFSHERLLAPVHDAATDTYTVRAGDERWTFRARVLPLEHWAIDEASLRREVNGAPAEPDAQELILSLAPELGIPETLLGVYLEEIAATLGSAGRMVGSIAYQVATAVKPTRSGPAMRGSLSGWV